MSDLLSLKEELDLYLPGLSQRAGLIVANKIGM
jgi:GTPase involved in cell partitioning and DNA repair